MNLQHLWVFGGHDDWLSTLNLAATFRSTFRKAMWDEGARIQARK